MELIVTLSKKPVAVPVGMVRFVLLKVILVVHFVPLVLRIRIII